MAEIKVLNRRENDAGEIFMNVAAVDGDGKSLSTGGFSVRDSRYGAGYVKALIAGGISTPVENRRGGNIRKMFYTMFDMASELGAPVSLLHPFSFAYYRMFGYEKVSDHLIMRLPVRMLDFVPRRCTLTRFTDESQRADLMRIYDEFSSGRNIMIARRTPDRYNPESTDTSTFICYEGGRPAGYVTFSTKKTFIVNHLGDGLMTVSEICYTTPSALRELMSFMRMYEGELEEIEFTNIAMCPEIEYMLRHYTHTSYRLVPDIMARVLDVPAMLRANAYPESEGSFTVRVDDSLDFTKGAYRVEFGGGDSRVTRLPFETDADLALSMQAFSRLIYGYDGASPATAAYMDSVELSDGRGAADFFRSFPKTPCGVFEHF